MVKGLFCSYYVSRANIYYKYTEYLMKNYYYN